MTTLERVNLRIAVREALQLARAAARADYLGFSAQGDADIDEAVHKLTDAIAAVVDPR